LSGGDQREAIYRSAATIPGRARLQFFLLQKKFCIAALVSGERLRKR
jgi:hypothetical protein